MSNTRETRPQAKKNTLHVLVQNEKGQTLLVSGKLPSVAFDEHEDLARAATVCFVEQTGLTLINPIEADTEIAADGSITKIFTGEYLQLKDSETKAFSWSE